MGVKKIVSVLVLLIIVAVLLPAFQVGSTTSYRLDRIAQFFTIPLIFLLWGKIKKLPLSKKFINISLALMVTMTISEFIGHHFFSSSQALFTLRPLLILAKTLVFVFFLYTTVREYIKIKILFQIVSLVFLASLMFGVLQYFQVTPVVLLSLKYYVMTETQVNNFAAANRIFGTSGMIISWSGLCIIIFYFFYFLNKNPLLRTSGALLAFLNIIGAGSRAGIIALVVSFLYVQFIKAVVVRRSAYAFFSMLIITFILIVGAFALLNAYMPEQIEFLTRRFEKVEDAITVEGRGAQLLMFSRVMNENPETYFFGIGSLGIADVGYLEIDPAFILVSYGLVGFTLHYLLLWFLLREAKKLKDYYTDGYLFIIAATIGSLIFSLGFFFLHEPYMGMPYWWLCGIVIGIMYKNRMRQLEENKQ